MSDATRFERRDWIIAAWIFLAAAALRIPFRSELAFHWDCVEFMRAISHYNMALNEPHPPGYFLYVMLGRLVNLWLGDPHASLVCVSLVAGALVAGGGYLLGTWLFCRACGAATAVILATGPTCWFHGEVAMSTMLDSALTLMTVLAFWLAIQQGGSWRHLTLLCLSFALVAANRGHSSVGLLPVWLYTFYRLPPPRWPRLLVAVVLTGVFCCAWFVPLVQTCGGLGGFMECYSRMWNRLAEFTFLGGGSSNLVISVVQVTASCWTGLLLAGVVAGIELVRWAIFQPREAKLRLLKQHREPLIFLALWLAPQVLLGLFVFYTTCPGHVLSYFPAVAVLAGLALCRAAKGIGDKPKWPALSALLAAVAIINAAVFLFQPRGSFALPLTSAQRRQDEQQLKSLFSAIRSRYPAATTWICHRGEFFYCGFQHFAYYMPEYPNVLLTHDAALPKGFADKFRVSHQKRIAFVERVEFPASVTQLLLLVPPGWSLDLYAPLADTRRARLVEGTSGMLYELEAGAFHR